MHWTDEDPGFGEFDSLEHLSRQMRDRSEHAGDMVDMLGRAGRGMAEYWSGDAADAWADRVRDDLATYAHLHQSADDERSAIVIYVDTVHTIARQARSAAGRLTDAQDATASLARQQDPLTPRQLSQRDDADDDARAATRTLLRLADERRDADQVFVSRLQALSEKVRTSPKVSRFGGAEVRSMEPVEALRQLSRLDSAQMIAVLAEYPGIISQFEGVSPATVSAWWESLSPDRQEVLVECVPEVIGNLDGVDFESRDAANRQAVSAALVAKKAELAGARSHNAMVAPAYRIATGKLEDEVAALLAVRASARRDGSGVRRMIVSFDLTGRPKAAVAIGNPDTASQVTTLVPGMGSTVGGSMESWTAGASALYRAQTFANVQVAASHESGLATVAWIGYDAPDMPPSAQVLESTSAREGGRKLSRFLRGVSASRGWEPGQNLSIVAHSYGTTTAAAALTTTKAENLTMLASAGLNARTSSQLMVPSSHIWATQARGDRIADIGRGVVRPPGLRPFLIPSTHRTDPAAPGFGGHVFSSQTSGEGSSKLFQTDGHSATPQIEAELNGTTSSKHGYLDPRTTSLFNTSLTSLGLGGSGAVIVP